MKELIDIEDVGAIPEKYRGTPIGLLAEYHNLNKAFDVYKNAKLLIGMCMDNRKHLHIPDNFAFIIRAGGANLRHSEFKVSFAISIGGVQHIALIGHNNCGMANLHDKKEQFVSGLVERAGWTRERAEEHFVHLSPRFETGSETDFILSEAKRLREFYPKIVIAPMFYTVEDNKLHFIGE
jgi:carbonic anhydrase